MKKGGYAGLIPLMVVLGIVWIGGARAVAHGASTGGWSGAIRAGEREIKASPARRLKELKGDLRSPDSARRRRAVAKLAGIGGSKAFQLVVEALANEEAEAADEAQLQLPVFEASLGTQRLQRELTGRAGLRSPDPMVRLRVAEAFGRMGGPVDGEALIRRIDRRDPDMSGALLWSVERLAVRGALGADPAELVEALDRHFRSGVADPVRARAVAALVQLDPAAFVERRDQLAKLRGPETTCAVLRAEVVAATGAGAAAIGAVVRALSHGDPKVRAMAIRLFPRTGPAPGDLHRLAERLGEEPRPALRDRIVATLQGMTGWKHRERVEAWVHGIRALPEDWSAPPPDGDRPGEAIADPKGASAATLSRLAPMSDRVAFLVDFSGSLWHQREDGSCRKDLLDPEMDRLLDQLDPTSRFALIPFTATPHPYADGNVPATRREVTRAKRFFSKAKMRGQGNLYDAVHVALASGEVDRLIILTDGAPTGGVRSNVHLMGDLFVEETRFRPVIFDFVLLDAPLHLQRAWASVARRTGGRTLSLKM